MEQGSKQLVRFEPKEASWVGLMGPAGESVDGKAVKFSC